MFICLLKYKGATPIWWAVFASLPAFNLLAKALCHCFQRKCTELRTATIDGSDEGSDTALSRQHKYVQLPNSGHSRSSGAAASGSLRSRLTRCRAHVLSSTRLVTLVLLALIVLVGLICTGFLSGETNSGTTVGAGLCVVVASWLSALRHFGATDAPRTLEDVTSREVHTLEMTPCPDDDAPPEGQEPENQDPPPEPDLRKLSFMLDDSESREPLPESDCAGETRSRTSSMLDD